MTTRLARLAAGCVAALSVTFGVAAPAEADGFRDRQWHLSFLHVDQAQRYSEGDGVVVGVVDTGVQADHPDLVGSVLPGADVSDPAGDGHTDRVGHGTGVAGLIAGHGHGANDGVLGIAPRAKILPVAVVGITPGHNEIALGIKWAVEHGARVICLAVGDVTNDDAELRSAVKSAFDHDVVMVAAVGNKPDVSDVVFPARYQGVIAAAGVDRNGDHAPFSVTGPAVVLSAPAADIETTNAGNGYAIGTGTSAATAIIAGTAALVRARFPNLSAKEVVHRLTATAIDKGPPGRDDQYGYGIVNLVGALTADVPPLQPSASPPPTASAHAAPPHRTNAALPLTAVAVLALLAAGGVLLLRRRAAADG